MKEAMFYEKLEENAVRCHLCAHHCKINESKRGICGVRENRGGVLYSLVYGKVIARGIDPIEKKPFFHFHPGSEAYSIATVGCNFRCKNCQNYHISQMPKGGEKQIVGEDASPEEIVAAARQNGCKTIAYTYTEPTIFFELAYDTARLARKEGIYNVFVSNGYITEEAIRTLAPYLDAINVDLKGSEGMYRKICGGHLQPVLDAIKLYKSLGVWVEATTLVIPTLNDSEEEFRWIAEFIKSVGVDVPWHISQFYPAYKLPDLPPTPVTTLRKAREIGLDVGLRYVYEGNVPGEGGENTYCYQCGGLLIRRYGFQILENKIRYSRCPKCGAKIDGILDT
ncbi:MAG: AmmeMemoRadiSam system radical SAM enzyme [Candidatus Methanospirareceae archaeon]